MVDKRRRARLEISKDLRAKVQKLVVLLGQEDAAESDEARSAVTVLLGRINSLTRLRYQVEVACCNQRLDSRVYLDRLKAVMDAAHSA